jgi:arabinofuranosyltransferase
VTTGRWISRHLPVDAVVAVNDVGAIAYFSGRRILDLEGLVSPDILPYRSLPDRGIRVVMDKRPNYLAIFPNWYPDISRSAALHEIHRVHISDNYISAGDTLIVYDTPWSRIAEMTGYNQAGVRLSATSERP